MTQSNDFESSIDAVAVRLEHFEGPLDLLLHLIRKNEVNIYDIPIALIAAQYLDTIELLTELNLEAAGEYLVMAATLIHIKSRMMLPRPPSAAGIIEGEAEDPRDALVRRLLEHQKFKAAAGLLHEREQVRAAQWLRPDERVAAIAGEDYEPELEVDLFSLLNAFQAVVQRLKQRPRVLLPPEQIPIETRIDQLLARLSETEACGFDELFLDVNERAGLIVTFLALLEMIRLKLVRVFQSGSFGPIRVYRDRARPTPLTRSATRRQPVGEKDADAAVQETDPDTAVNADESQPPVEGEGAAMTSPEGRVPDGAESDTVDGHVTGPEHDRVRDAVAPAAEAVAAEAGDNAPAESTGSAGDSADRNAPADEDAGSPASIEPLERASAELKAIVEALIFASPDPLSLKALIKLLEGEPQEDVATALQELKQDYERPGGLQLVEVAGGFQIVTRHDLHEWVRRLFHERSTQRLSAPALETLAVVAYRQPITAAEITDVRGVNTSGVLNTLLERHLIKIVGRKAVVGRPFMYATTRDFLIRFGLNDLTDLPRVEDMVEALGLETPLLIERATPEDQLPLMEPEDTEPAPESIGAEDPDGQDGDEQRSKDSIH